MIKKIKASYRIRDPGNSLRVCGTTLVGMLAATIGFLIQFWGIRALHYSVAVMQLGVTVVMTAIRSWVRRGLSTNPHKWDLLPRGFERS